MQCWDLYLRLSNPFFVSTIKYNFVLICFNHFYSSNFFFFIISGEKKERKKKKKRRQGKKNLSAENSSKIKRTFLKKKCYIHLPQQSVPISEFTQFRFTRRNNFFILETKKSCSSFFPGEKKKACFFFLLQEIGTQYKMYYTPPAGNSLTSER